MVVDVTNLNAMHEIKEPQILFNVAMNDISLESFSPYDVTPDGQRFLVNIPETPEPLLFIQGLEKLMQKGEIFEPKSGYVSLA